MFPVNIWPYTNLHSLNLDWVLETTKKNSETLENLPSIVSELVANMIESGTQFPRVVPEMFGAVGDGVTNDTDAFLRFLNHIALNGLTGYLGEKTYVVSGKAFVAPENGGKRWGVVGGTNSKLKQLYNQNCLSIHSSKNFFFKNFEIVCNGSPNMEYGNAIYLWDCDDALFENIEITNCSRGGILAYPGNNAYLENMRYINVNIHGVENTTPFNPPNDNRLLYPMGFILVNHKNGLVDSCFIENMKYFPFEAKNSCVGLSFVNCKARNCDNVCYVGRDSDSVEGAKNCTYDVECEECGQFITAGVCENLIFKVRGSFRENTTIGNDLSGAINTVISETISNYPKSMNILFEGTTNSGCFAEVSASGLAPSRIQSKNITGLDVLVKSRTSALNPEQGEVVSSMGRQTNTKYTGEVLETLQNNGNLKIKTVNSSGGSQEIQYIFTDASGNTNTIRINKNGFITN